MAYVDVSVEYDIGDAWSDLSQAEKKEFLLDALEDYPEFRRINPEVDYNLTDPIIRIAIITELRGLGYTVESNA